MNHRHHLRDRPPLRIRHVLGIDVHGGRDASLSYLALKVFRVCLSFHHPSLARTLLSTARIWKVTEPSFGMYFSFPQLLPDTAGLVFGMPPLEAAFHEAQGNDLHELYLM